MDKVKRRDRPLTFYQRHVLLTLSVGGPYAATDWNAWYPMGESQVRGVIERLAQRGLVDVAGWTQGTARESRTFKLTDAGWAAVEAMDKEGEDEPDE